MTNLKVSVPDWADEWAGRRKCPVCKARLVICYTWGTAVEVCSETGWAVEPDRECHPAPDVPGEGD